MSSYLFLVLLFSIECWSAEEGTNFGVQASNEEATENEYVSPNFIAILLKISHLEDNFLNPNIFEELNKSQSDVSNENPRTPASRVRKSPYLVNAVPYSNQIVPVQNSVPYPQQATSSVASPYIAMRYGRSIVPLAAAPTLQASNYPLGTLPNTISYLNPNVPSVVQGPAMLLTRRSATVNAPSMQKRSIVPVISTPALLTSSNPSMLINSIPVAVQSPSMLLTRRETSEHEKRHKRSILPVITPTLLTSSNPSMLINGMPVLNTVVPLPVQSPSMLLARRETSRRYKKSIVPIVTPNFLTSNNPNVYPMNGMQSQPLYPNSNNQGLYMNQIPAVSPYMVPNSNAYPSNGITYNVPNAYPTNGMSYNAPSAFMNGLPTQNSMAGVQSPPIFLIRREAIPSNHLKHKRSIVPVVASPTLLSAANPSFGISSPVLPATVQSPVVLLTKRAASNNHLLEDTPNSQHTKSYTGPSRDTRAIILGQVQPNPIVPLLTPIVI